jgi:hypothetical protein
MITFDLLSHTSPLREQGDRWPVTNTSPLREQRDRTPENIPEALAT